MSIATATEDREVFGPTAAYDAAKREIREGNDVYKLHRHNGTWTGWPSGTWNETERAIGAVLTRELGRAHPDREKRRVALERQARGLEPIAEADAVAVRNVQAAMRADRNRKWRAMELASDLNRAESVAPVPVGAAAGGR